MSNIYVLTRTANQRLEVLINVGSRNLSKTIAKIQVIKTTKGFSLYMDKKLIREINSDTRETK